MHTRPLETQTYKVVRPSAKPNNDVCYDSVCVYVTSRFVQVSVTQNESEAPWMSGCTIKHAYHILSVVRMVAPL